MTTPGRPTIKLDTFGKKMAWIYTKADIFETEDARNPVVGFKALPFGGKDFIKKVYNCPTTNEMIEVYEQSNTVVRYINKGIYPLTQKARNKAKVSVSFADLTVINIDYADGEKRRLFAKTKPVQF